jgi:hypothetical protein
MKYTLNPKTVTAELVVRVENDISGATEVTFANRDTLYTLGDVEVGDYYILEEHRFIDKVFFEVNYSKEL